MPQSAAPALVGNLLVVTADRPLADDLARLLAQAGHSVRQVADRCAALESARHDPPDLILLADATACDERADANARPQFNLLSAAAPVVVVGPADDPSVKDRAFGLGGVEYIPTPLHHAEVLARVRHQLELSRMRRLLYSQASGAESGRGDLAAQPEQAQLRQSEQMLQSVLEHFPGVVFWKDRSSVYLGCNRAFSTGAGLSDPAQIVGTTDDELPWASTEAAKYRADDQEVIASGRPKLNIVEPQLQADGRVAWFNTNKVPLFDDQDRVIGVLGTSNDITERRQAEEALKASEERFAAFMRHLPAAAFIKDSRGRTLFANQYLVDMFGWQHWEGKMTVELIDDVVGTQMSADDQQALRDGVIVVQETIVDVHGHARTFETIKFPIPTPHGPPYLGGISLDITERERAEAAIRRQNRELTLLNQVIAASASEGSADAMLALVCQALGQAFEVDRVFAVILNDSRSDATVLAETHLAGPPSLLGRSFALADHHEVAQQLLGQKTPLVVGDVRLDSRLARILPVLREQGIASLLSAPIVSDGQVLGLVTLTTATPRSFAADEVALLQSVTAQVAGDLARLRLDAGRRLLEAQYFQAQKMEALGRLTGGVAHDFNNILMAIIGNSEFLMEGLEPDEPLWQDAEQIRAAADRAAVLIRQMLAFSRKQILQPSMLDLNAIVTGIEKMLRRVIGEDIHLLTMLDLELGQVSADASQIEQVIMNLAVNARDAMPNGGRLTIETANIDLDESFTRWRAGVVAGPYVLLTISDTGHGMDAETQSHIFEPFFTTKGPGRGTGLGLATVHGIISQCEGHIWVYSEPGVGTTFKIYLPRVNDPGASDTPVPDAAALQAGRETILLVEDDEMVRRFVSQLLTRSGYRVFVAGTAAQARELCAACHDPLDLLLTDVVIPGDQNGVQLARDLLRLHPEARVLYMSGYADDAIVDHGLLATGAAFLPKPFSSADLLRRVREVLDGVADERPASRT